MKIDVFQEQVLLCTARIVVPLAERNERSVGTGFLVGAPIADGRQLLLLVSNKHVFVGSQHVAQVAFHRCDSSDQTKPRLGETIKTNIPLSTGGFTEHPNSEVDLACVNISDLRVQRSDAFYKLLSIEDSAATFEEDWLLPGGDICFVGYPAGLFDEQNNLPVLRSGTIASHPKIFFNGKPQFLIDAHVHGGSSGSPVFALSPPWINQAARLVGVVTQTVMRKDKIVPIARAEEYAVNSTIGIGIVLRIELVRELVEAAVLRFFANQNQSRPPQAAAS